jgi:hypothetical protein
VRVQPKNPAQAFDDSTVAALERTIEERIVGCL